MKKIAAALALAGFAFTPALAGDLEGHCEAYAANNGTDASGCSCLAESADADVTAELMTVETAEDLEALSDAAKATIAACFPAA